MIENMNHLSNRTDLEPVATTFFPDIRVDMIDFFSLSLNNPLNYKVEKDGGIYFYLILSGEAWLHCEGSAPNHVTAGSVISVGRPLPHIWSTIENSDLSKSLKTVQFDPVADTTEVDDLPELYASSDCTAFCIRAPAPSNPLPDILPPIVRISEEDRDEVYGFWTIINLIKRAEMRSTDAGNLLLKRLIEVVIIIMLRFGLKNMKITKNEQMKGLYDKRIRNILSLMHSQPSDPWTLESLSEKAGMSRTGFIERFKKYTADTPLHYLATLRMQKAINALNTTSDPLSQIAHDVGYQSETSFIKAFRRELGITPGRYRELSRTGRLEENVLLPIIANR